MARMDMIVTGVLVTMMVAFGPMAVDLYLPALPQMVNAFETDISRVQLTLSVYMAGFAISQIVHGPLSDRFGRRPVLLAGIALFGITSLASTAVMSIGQLLVLRFVQAFGAAAGVVLGRAVIRDLFEREEAARMLSFVASAMALAPLLAPILGGYLTDNIGWRANFWALTLFAVIVFLAMAVGLPESNKHKDRDATRPEQVVGHFSTMLRHREYVGYVAVTTLLFACLFAYISGSSFVLVDVMGLTPQAFGLAFAVNSLGYAVGSQISGRLVRRIGMERLCGMGTAVAAISGTFMAALAIGGVTTPAAVVLPMLGVMFGIGSASPSAMAGAVNPFPRNAGAASSLLGVIQFGFAAAAGAAVGVLHTESAIPMSVTIALAAIGASLCFYLVVPSRPAAGAKQA